MKRCFFISPIGVEDSEIRKEADEVFKLIVKPAMKRCKIGVFRADDLDKPGKITEQMFQEIRQSILCIADLTGSNPNVFYELAIAQMLNKPVIIIIKKGEKIPFDIKDFRIIQYRTDSIDNGTYIKQIVNYVTQFETNNWVVPPLFKSDEEYIYIEKIKDRSALYRKATEMIEKADKIMDTTWGKVAKEMTKDQKAARDKYRETIDKAITRGAEYKELFSFNEKFIKEYQLTTTKFEAEPQYEARFLYGLSQNFPVIDCLITDQNEVLLSHVSFQGNIPIPTYLFIRSENVANFYAGLFDDCWQYAKQNEKQNNG